MVATINYKASIIKYNYLLVLIFNFATFLLNRYAPRCKRDLPLSSSNNNFTLFWVVLDFWNGPTHTTPEEVPFGIRELRSSHHVYLSSCLCFSISGHTLLAIFWLEVASRNPGCFFSLGEHLFVAKRSSILGSAYYYAFKCLQQFCQDHLFACVLDTDI